MRVSGVGPGDHVLEVGPGLGSLTLALLPVVGQVTAVERPQDVAARIKQVNRVVLVDRSPVEADPLELSAQAQLRGTDVPAWRLARLRNRQILVSGSRAGGWCRRTS